MDVMIPLSQLADMLIVAIAVCTVGHIIGVGLGLLIEFCVKKIHDKRDSMAKRDTQREIDRALKERSR